MGSINLLYIANSNCMPFLSLYVIFMLFYFILILSPYSDYSILELSPLLYCFIIEIFKIFNKTYLELITVFILGWLMVGIFYI